MIDEMVIRKKIEFEQKVKAFQSEMKSWCERSEPKKELEKHHTQIRAIQVHLEVWNKAVSDKLKDYEQEEADTYLGKCANAHKLILSEHRIWEYFRSKLLQRNDTLFSTYLKTADEFAWACYRPIQELVYPDPKISKRKEPPLVFLNGGASPFSVSRGRAFQPEAVAGESLMIAPDDDVIGKLPVPVVGVPWSQVSYLPDALVIGHEVGHIVEDDFQLTDRLTQLLDEALAEAEAEPREDAWKSWLGEIFADLYGCLAAGPAFASALIDYLMKSGEQISGEVKAASNWGRYPTDYLRVKILFKALDEIKFDRELKNYRTLWEGYSSSMPDDFIKDIEIIVPKLLNGPHQVLAGKSIREAFCFSAGQQKKVIETALEIGRVRPDTDAPISANDIRVLLAAARAAYEIAPNNYITNKCDEALMRHIEKKVIKPGFRANHSEEVFNSRLKSYARERTEEVKTLIEEAFL
jgi:hypothetical protein